MNKQLIIYILLIYIIIVTIIVITFTFFVKNYYLERFTNDNTTKVLNYKAIIVGTARNISEYVDKNIPKLISISKLFSYCPIVIYENDSNDNTLELLNKYAITIISEKNIEGNRTTRLAHGRNTLHDYAINLNIPFDYYIVCDLDDKIEKLTAENIASCFKHANNWSMMGANQETDYYDLWALRTKDDWCNIDCWDTKDNIIGCKYKNIPSNSELIEVDSCFGGTGIYRFNHTIGCRYSSFPQEFSGEICEHVPFHKSMRQLYDAKLFINPEMINS